MIHGFSTGLSTGRVLPSAAHTGLQRIGRDGRKCETFGAERPALDDQPVTRQSLPANDVAQIEDEVI
ncbi:MAG: hypothetical protein ACREC0_08510, partial [Methylocella sp.]